MAEPQDQGSEILQYTESQNDNGLFTYGVVAANGGAEYQTDYRKNLGFGMPRVPTETTSGFVVVPEGNGQFILQVMENGEVREFKDSAAAVSLARKLQGFIADDGSLGANDKQALNREIHQLMQRPNSGRDGR